MLKCDCGSRIYVGNKCRECYMANPPMTTDQRIAELEAENKRLRSTLAQVREWEENTLMKKARREALLNILSTDTRRKEVT